MDGTRKIKRNENIYETTYSSPMMHVSHLSCPALRRKPVRRFKELTKDLHLCVQQWKQKRSFKYTAPREMIYFFTWSIILRGLAQTKKKKKKSEPIWAYPFFSSASLVPGKRTERHPNIMRQIPQRGRCAPSRAVQTWPAGQGRRRPL
jgi:hypothetical protein